MRAKHESPSAKIERSSDNERYVAIICEIERVANYFGLDHRFVGGTLTDLLNPQVDFMVDIENRFIRPRNHSRPTMYRSDGTVKDIDMVCFCPDQTRVQDATKTFKNLRQNQPFPDISLEPSFYAHWPKRNRLAQMVSTFDVDGENNAAPLSLNFGPIREYVSWQSVEPWKVILDSGERFTIFNPYAHGLRYFMRNPAGVKRKDREKIPLLMTMGSQVLLAELEHGSQHIESTYDSWERFTLRMLHPNDLITKGKAKGTRFYWNTVGTFFAHGRGLTRPLARLGNRFTG